MYRASERRDAYCKGRGPQIQQNKLRTADSAPMLAVASELWAARGLRGFYAGVSVAWAKSAPAACITYYTYETAKAAF